MHALRYVCLQYLPISSKCNVRKLYPRATNVQSKEVQRRDFGKRRAKKQLAEFSYRKKYGLLATYGPILTVFSLYWIKANKYVRRG